MSGGDEARSRLAALVAEVVDPGDRAARHDALARVDPADVGAVLRGGTADEAAPLLARGVGASPGVVAGRVWLDPERAVAAAESGEPGLLVVPATTPADAWALAEVVGVVTTSGGVASHAAVVARAHGLPAVCGAPLDLADGAVRGAGGVEVAEGAVLTIDGATGEVRVGAAAVDVAEAPPELDVLLAWADDVRTYRSSPVHGHPVAVLANADTAAEVHRAVELGAEGIGLCRTEHQLAVAAPALLRAVVAADPEALDGQLDELARVQQAEAEALLAAAGDLPVVVRLLDPLRHEVLPPLEELAVAEAEGRLDDAGRAELARRRRSEERNPMLGARGVRLAVVHQRLYRVQAAAVAAAVRTRRQAGGDPDVRLLVPMVVSAAELAAVAAAVDEAVGAVLDPTPPPSVPPGSTVVHTRILTPGRPPHRHLPIGAMVETPRAALEGGPLARVADFLSVGTNDLTQLTLGLSRDDVTALVARYVADGLLEADPFTHLDPAVGRLVQLAGSGARAARSDVAVGACGEHAGDPASIAALVAAGVDSVSCSPERLPLARLGVARALLGAA